MSTCGPSPTSKVNMRFCTPTCGAARPTPAASYIVSTIVSTNRASRPSMSVTSLAVCFSTGSPKTRTGYVLMRPARVRDPSLVALTQLAEHPDEVHRRVGRVLAGGVGDRGERAGVRERAGALVEVPAHRRARVDADADALEGRDAEQHREPRVRRPHVAVHDDVDVPPAVARRGEP